MNGQVAAAIPSNQYVGQTATFTITPTYNVAMGTFIAGQVISIGTITPQLPVTFGPNHGAKAVLDAFGTFGPITYSQNPLAAAMTQTEYLATLPTKVSRRKEKEEHKGKEK